MKKAIFYTALSAIVAGSFLTSCESKQEKVEEAKEDVAEAKEDLKEAQRELNAEYPTFKTDAEKKIEANDKRIAELQEKLDKPGKKPLDEDRKRRIEELRQKNVELRTRLYGYEQERSDWESFKREWNHDMESLEHGVNDLDENNVR